MTTDPDHLAYSISQACKALGIGKSKLYDDAKAGLVQLGTFRGKTVIEAEELRRYFQANFKPKKAA